MNMATKQGKMGSRKMGSATILRSPHSAYCLFQIIRFNHSISPDVLLRRPGLRSNILKNTIQPEQSLYRDVRTVFERLRDESMYISAFHSTP